MLQLTHHTLRRYIFVMLLALALPFTAGAQSTAEKPGSIHFIGNSFQEALHQAALQHKYIFVDAYASWCGPCKMLRAYTFSDKKAGDFFNAHFINVSIDMEKGEGPDLSQAWGITAYPTLIIFDQNGKAVLGTVGYINASQLIKFAKQALAPPAQ